MQTTNPDGVQHETLTGEGLEVWLGYGANNAIHYTICGAGISSAADIWIGRRDDLLDTLLSPLGCAERDGAIISTVA